jgi:hypothetical protein
MMKFALAFVIAVALAAALLPTAISAGADSHNRLAAPFSPQATIYRPDCWLRDEPTFFCNVGGGLLKEEED